ncbi:MAG: hypothetical protein GY856_38685, partial [bacterium]|nr:hypothetical protein [bacterium]
DGDEATALKSVYLLFPITREILRRVQDAFRARRAAGDGELSYLVYPRELDPAAARQLDVYRLREDTVIIPLSLPFLRAKRDEGEDAASYLP